jgi:hypothetical protein
VTSLLVLGLAHLLNSPALPPLAIQATVALEWRVEIANRKESPFTVSDKANPFTRTDKPNPFDDLPPRLQ